MFIHLDTVETFSTCKTHDILDKLLAILLHSDAGFWRKWTLSPYELRKTRNVQSFAVENKSLKIDWMNCLQ